MFTDNIFIALFSEHIHCEDLVGLKDVLVGLVTVVVLQMVLNLVASFVSCFAIAHQQDVWEVRKNSSSVPFLPAKCNNP